MITPRKTLTLFEILVEGDTVPERPTDWLVESTSMLIWAAGRSERGMITAPTARHTAARTLGINLPERPTVCA